MIRVQETDRGPTLEGDLPDGAVAYVDAAWIDPDTGSAPAIVVIDDRIRFEAGPEVDDEVALDDGVEPEAAAACCLHAVAREAAACVSGVTADEVEIVGSGFIAAQLRRLIDVPSASRPAESARPAAVVELTGAPAAIAEAMGRVADLGLVVLVGQALGRRLPIDLYADVHSRGLTLAGVAPPLASGLAEQGLVPDWPPAAPVSSGAPLPAADWYRVGV